MASKTIGVVLSLRDQMSSGLLKVNKNIEGITKEAKRASQQVASFAQKSKDHFEKIGDKAIKAGAVIVGALGGMALKTGIGEGMNMEGFRTQLMTATKDAKKAAKIMKWSVELANATPFETGEVVEGSARLEAMGLSAQKNLGIIGDMAGATNKPLLQGVEAFIDAQTGELERLKEFGIKKMDIAKKANEMFRGQEVINQKGQIVDQEKFNQALLAIMNERYKGGAEMLAQTAKGMWSTVTGIVKNSLAKIVGLTDEGTIKQGSIMEKLKGKIKEVADTLQKWQSDGTMDAIANKASEIFTKVYDVISKVITFIVEHKDAIANVAIVFTSFYIAIKIFKVLKGVIFGVQIAIGLLNGTLMLTPLGWVMVAITAVIAIGLLLWKNWDKIKQGAQALWTTITTVFTNIWTTITTVFTNIWTTISTVATNIWTGIVNIFTNIWTTITTIFTAIWTTISNILTSIWTTIVTVFTTIWNVIVTILTPIGLFIEAVFKGILAIIILVGAWIWNSIVTMWTNVWSVIQPILTAIWNVITTVWTAIWTTITTIAMAIWNTIVNVWNTIAGVVSTVMSAIWGVISSIWSTIYGTVSGIMSSIWSTITDIWNNIVSTVSDIVGNIASTISDGFNALIGICSDIFNNIKNTVMGIFEGIWDGIKSIINGGIDMLNNFIGGVNKVISKANKVPGVNIGAVSEIPHFAKGTRYSPAGMALINEEGGELRKLSSGETILPADKSRQLMNGASSPTFNIYFIGNVGTEEFFDQAGQHIISQVRLAMQNM
ncbi:TPA: phage tail tape measure protein [Clostridium botulinum]|nr:phage tail tape measure protein [Clostridium botulinum]